MSPAVGLCTVFLGHEGVNPLVHSASGTVYTNSGFMHEGDKSVTERRFSIHEKNTKCKKKF